ncbi:MAG: family 10 glycosylhydrolase [Candidatus Cloacimonas sp.]
MKRAFLIVWIILIVKLNAEIRSVWIMPWDITTENNIDQIIDTAIACQQNELLVEVRYRADALFETSKGSYLYVNPEPVSYVLNTSNFDPLAYIIEKAHQNGIAVQAWIVVLNATQTEQNLIRQNYIYKNHKDWVTYDKNGNRMNNGYRYGYFIDPGVPEVQEYLLNIIGNLAAGYPDLDGIHLDYIRYPDSNLGYHPISVERYKEYCQNQEEITYNEWRIKQINNFVENAYFKIKEINPSILLTAAVFADIADANVSCAQDWQTWLNEGFIDRVYPMAYDVNYSRFAKQMDQIKLLNMDSKIVIGIRAWNDNGSSLAIERGAYYNVRDVAKKIELIRDKGFAGISLFSYSGLQIGNAWEQLAKLSYSEKSDYPFFKVTSQPINRPVKEPMCIADVRLSRLNADILLQLKIPDEGLWNWELYKDKFLLKFKRYYMKGDNIDILNVINPNLCSDLESGKYTVQLYQENSAYKFFFPVELKNSR